MKFDYNPVVKYYRRQNWIKKLIFSFIIFYDYLILSNGYNTSG